MMCFFYGPQKKCPAHVHLYIMADQHQAFLKKMQKYHTMIQVFSGFGEKQTEIKSII